MNEETKARIALEAAYKADDGMAHWSPMKAYIAGREEEAERSKALYDCLKLIREMPEGVWFAKTIDKALEKYDNSK